MRPSNPIIKQGMSCSEQDCVVWGSRVIIPPIFRPKMLEQLHWERPGICGMKTIARTCMWCPKMDQETEEAVRDCTVCQNVRNAQPSAPLIPWKWPTRPFQRIHIDFCQKGNDYFLVVIDSHSKWIEVRHMSFITTQRTIDELGLIFATHGLSEEVVSENGPQFTSTDFTEFMRKNGMKHTLVPPYHPQSNGTADRSVRVVKDDLVKQVLEGNKGISMRHRLAKFLFRYRTTRHSTTDVTPAEFMVKRHLRTKSSLIKPNLAQVVENKQEKQKMYKDLKCKRERSFARNDSVRVRNPRANSKTDTWIPGTVIKVCRRRPYVVRTGHTTRYVHTDHMIRAYDNVPDADIMVPESSSQKINDNVNPLDSTSEPHVDLPENADVVVFPLVE